MDTARVDIQKLQLLNDRINQTIEALQQLRFSVHGLEHSTPLPHVPQQAYGIGAQPQQAFVPPAAYSQVPVAFAQPWQMGKGISHSSFELDPSWRARVAHTFPNVAFRHVPVAIY